MIKLTTKKRAEYLYGFLRKKGLKYIKPYGYKNRDKIINNIKAGKTMNKLVARLLNEDTFAFSNNDMLAGIMINKLKNLVDFIKITYTNKVFIIEMEDFITRFRVEAKTLNMALCRAIVTIWFVKYYLFKGNV